MLDLYRLNLVALIEDAVVLFIHLDSSSKKNSVQNLEIYNLSHTNYA